MQLPKSSPHFGLVSHQGQFHTLLTFDDCGPLPASPETNPTIFTPFQHLSDCTLWMASPPLSSLASTEWRFWRCSLTNFWTPGNCHISWSPNPLFESLTQTLWTNISPSDYMSVISIVLENVTNADTQFVAPWTSIVGQFTPSIVCMAK